MTDTFSVWNFFNARRYARTPGRRFRSRTSAGQSLVCRHRKGVRTRNDYSSYRERTRAQHAAWLELLTHRRGDGIKMISRESSIHTECAAVVACNGIVVSKFARVNDLVENFVTVGCFFTTMMSSLGKDNDIFMFRDGWLLDDQEKDTSLGKKGFKATNYSRLRQTSGHVRGKRHHPHGKIIQYGKNHWEFCAKMCRVIRMHVEWQMSTQPTQSRSKTKNTFPRGPILQLKQRTKFLNGFFKSKISFSELWFWVWSMQCADGTVFGENLLLLTFE